MQLLCQNEITMITSDSVERACVEVSEYSEEMMLSEFDRFFQQQPAICDFIVELTGESGQAVQEVALFLAYMVFKSFELGRPGPMLPVAAPTIESAYHESEEWMDRISKTASGDLQGAIAVSLQDDSEPHLLQYIISELNQPLEDEQQLEDDQKGEVFFVLKTVIASLARRGIEAE
jgi:hypothetical protein